MTLCATAHQVGSFNKHQAVRVLEKQVWEWARVDDYFEDDSSPFGSYSIELMDGRKRYLLEADDLKQAPRLSPAG